MLIMRGSYRDQGRFARPICDLASAIGSANPLRGSPAGASDAVKNSRSDKKTLHCVIKSICLLPSSAWFAEPLVQTDPPGLRHIVR